MTKRKNILITGNLFIKFPPMDGRKAIEEAKKELGKRKLKAESFDVCSDVREAVVACVHVHN